MSLRVHVYVITYNEEYLLPFFLRHYRDKYNFDITIIDNESTDETVKIARGSGCNVLSYRTGGQIRDDLMLGVKNNVWKSCDADYVIVVDIDEFIYHEGSLVDFLVKCKEGGYGLVIPVGYQMVSDSLPILSSLSHDEQLYDINRLGIYSLKYSKPCIFDPLVIKEIGYSFGCHTASPRAYGSKVIKVMRDVEEIKLLHYNMLSLEYYLTRYAERRKRLSNFNIKRGYGREYLYSMEQLTLKFNEMLLRARNVICV